MKSYLLITLLIFSIKDSWSQPANRNSPTARTNVTDLVNTVPVIAPATIQTSINQVKRLNPSHVYNKLNSPANATTSLENSLSKNPVDTVSGVNVTPAAATSASTIRTGAKAARKAAAGTPP
jgi:hypothetical protein